MGIELGEAVSSVGSAVGGVASSVGRGFGPKLEVAPTLLINEGPVSLGALENTMIYKPGVFDLTGDLRFNPPGGLDLVEPLNEQAVVAEAEEISQAAKVVEFPAPKPLFSPVKAPVEIPLPSPDIIQIGRTKRALEVAGLTQLSTKFALAVQTGTETKTSFKQATASVTPQAREQQIAQPVEQEVEVEEVTEQELDIKEEEEVEEFRIKYLEDEEVSEERRLEIRQAVRLAKLEAEREGIQEIEGWRIAKFLPEHAGVRSLIVKDEGPDGSFEETVEEITDRKFSSEKEAVEIGDKIVAEKQPVKVGKYGRLVALEAVALVFKRHIVKRYPAKEVVVRRIIKKREVQLVKGQQTSNIVPFKKVEERIEPKIEDYGQWAEVFRQKAA